MPEQDPEKANRRPKSTLRARIFPKLTLRSLNFRVLRVELSREKEKLKNKPMCKKNVFVGNMLLGLLGGYCFRLFGGTFESHLEIFSEGI